MPSLKQLAILSLACSATIICGCDRSSTPQGQIVQKITEGRIAAASGDDAGRTKAETLLNQAANTPGAPDASVAQAKAALAQVHLSAANDDLKIVNENDLNASRIALQIAALGTQLGSSAAMVQGYNKLDPKEAKVAIEQQIVQAKGDASDSKWINQDGVSLPSLAAVNADIARLQGEIAKQQAQVKSLDAKRQAALADADKETTASESAKGQESVDDFTKASNARKQAADFQTQIDLINGQIMPMQQDLSVAQGRAAILQNVIAELSDESKTLDQGWQDVQNKIQAQLDLIKQIADAPSATPASTTEPTSSAGQSIAVKAAAMAQAVATADKARDDAASNLNQAIKAFKDAQGAASNAVSKLELALVDQPNLKVVYDQTIATLDPQAYRFRQADAQRLLAAMQIGQAGGLDARIKLRELLLPLMESANLATPKEINDPNLGKEFTEATAQAAQNLNDANDQLVNVIEGPAGFGAAAQVSGDLKKAARVAQIFVLYDEKQLATIEGNASLADQKEALAVAAVKSAVDAQASFPSLPGDLATYLPAPAAPTTAPSTAPAAQ